MLIQRVEDTLVCTTRHEGLGHMHLRIVRDAKGSLSVAVDPVGAHKGNWVFTVSGSAARYAAQNFEILTDLTICGIIDHWDEAEGPGKN
ncbi:MAG: carboxysome peptide B [Chromatiales bacterium]|nr:carboxysome peptide B [Chromatiales bacterium]